jgi:hypothetical protein
MPAASVGGGVEAVFASWARAELTVIVVMISSNNPVFFMLGSTPFRSADAPAICAYLSRKTRVTAEK